MYLVYELLKIDIWDSGNTAKKKFGVHISNLFRYAEFYLGPQAGLLSIVVMLTSCGG